jgi:ABC-2 type transport system ATP-binding protein
MNSILEVKDLIKHFPKSDFCLQNVSFSIPRGSIMGFVGENGAGKTTTISCILNTLAKDSGTIKLFGKEMTDRDISIRENIGIVFDGGNFSGHLTPHQLSKIMGGIYSRWDNTAFLDYLTRFKLQPDQKIKTYSKGMTMKLAIAVALSHATKLLILDEATSGLDPVVRDEMLDVFLDFVQDENHSILLSSHITSDLEKIADYITFIHNGKIILTAKKDDLIYQYGVMRCKESQFATIEKSDVIAYNKRDYQIDVLISNRQSAEHKYKNVIIDQVSIDDIMLLLIKGERA